MDDHVAFALAALSSEIDAAGARHDEVTGGMGERFFVAFRADFAEIRQNFDELYATPLAASEKRAQSVERSAASLLDRLRIHDAMVAEFAADVGREDLPVGYLMLIDKIFADVFENPVDPLVHVATAGGYSVSSRFGIIVNLPAVDPTNVLLSPILVHEVGHVLFGQITAQYNESRQTSAEELIAVAEAYPANDRKDEAEREAQLPLWAEELFCDAVATLVTGPSFLLALCSRTVGTNWAWHTGQDHPPPAIRLHLVLRLLQTIGWLPHMKSAAPAIVKWAEEISERSAVADDSRLNFLCKAALALEGGIIDLSHNVISDALRPESSARNVLEAARHFRHSVLPIDLPRSVSVEWEFLLGAWLVALEERGITPSAIPSVPFDKELNGLLVKTIELSRIAELWANDTSD